MDMFDTGKKPLKHLLDLIHNGELGLPDFQRSFVWEPNATRELLVSVIRSFPAGTILLQQGGGSMFAPRPFEGAPEHPHPPVYLALDGQQRLTSLYQAFSGVGPHRFFIHFSELIETDDLDEAVEVYAAKYLRSWSTIEGQAKALALPLERVFDFSNWRDEVVDIRSAAGDDAKQLRAILNEFEKQYVKPIESYMFPVTTLALDTPIEAVCTIFETLNRTGVKLTPFELITARAFANQVQLRAMWSLALETYPILDDFKVDPYYILQVIAVKEAGEAKRGIVLKLDVEAIVKRWPDAVRGMAEGLTMLRDECGVLTERWLPSQSIIIPLAALWQHVDAAKGPTVGARRAMLKRWFWCSCFSGAYTNAPNFQTSVDAVAVAEWMGGGGEPRQVRDFSFDRTQWREITVRQRALYQATMALLLSAGPLDFHTAAKLDRGMIDGQKVDDHHVFPRGWLAENGRGEVVDSVLNHTLIDKTTNIRIQKKAPSVYLWEIQDELGNKLDEVLNSHGLPSQTDGPLWQDRFDDFLDWRISYLATRLSKVTT